MNRSLTLPQRSTGSNASLVAAAGLAAALIGSLAYNEAAARRAERRYPPRGRFVEANGVRLHTLDTGGPGDAVLMLHGNGANFIDMELSGLVEALREDHRVIAFDRPGFGHSDRPRDTSWTPEAQADLIAAALERMQVGKIVAVAHSWSTLIAMALALRHPRLVKSLVLVSGYYVPTAQLDVALASPPAIPVLGDVMAETISPLVARLIARRAVRKMFAPLKTPERFRARFPLAFAFRPSQIRAMAQESAMLIPAAARLQPDYASLAAPLTIIAGAEDQIVDPAQSSALHEIVPNSALKLIPRCGHMAHYAAPELIAQAVRA